MITARINSLCLHKVKGRTSEEVNAVRRARILLVALGIILVLVPVVPVHAMKPLRGTMDLQFNLGWPGPQEAIPDWVGTITIDGEVYGMLFFAIGSGKAFVTPPYKGNNIHFFEEIWEIYDMANFQFEFNEDGVLTLLVVGQPFLWGYDEGQTNLKTSKYHMNGNVEEACGDFSMWEGRSVHMSGIIEWYPFGAPQYAPGTFRIN